MTSFELLNNINEILESIYSIDGLRKALQSMSQTYENMSGLLSAISSSPDSDKATYVSKLQDGLDLHSQSFKELRPTLLIRQTIVLESAIHKLRVLTNAENPNTLGHIGIRLSNFSTAYEQFIGNYGRPETLRLLSTAHDLYAALETAIEMLEGVAQNLEREYQGQEGESHLSILLHPANELHIIADKIKALAIVYEELCRLLNVSLAEYPLKIVKLESGSLWVKLFGESKIVALMTDLIKSGVDYLHRNFTREGKIAALPRNIEVIEAYLNLEQRMRELGYDTTGMREDIKKASSVITKELNTLLQGESVVELNNQIYTVGSALDRMIAEGSKNLLLKGDSDENTGNLLSDDNSKKN